MNDPWLSKMRLIMDLFPPMMILFPMVFVAFVPTRVESPEERDQASKRWLILIAMTVVALVIWGAITFFARQAANAPIEQFARFTWFLFFPLWFGLAMPAIKAKNPIWGNGLMPQAQNESGVRTASLKPRNRENPIRNWHWVIMAFAVVVPVALLAVRGAFAFGTADHPDPSARFRWALMTGVYLFCSLTTALIVPYCIQRSLSEPEPLDPAGSAELEAMYRDERSKRILGLFWLLGVVQPLFLGSTMCATVWLPLVSGQTMGILGAVGGVSLGTAGAIFGIVASIRRIRIAEEKARLESVNSSLAGPSGKI